jgi:hypothetical protein
MSLRARAPSRISGEPFCGRARRRPLQRPVRRKRRAAHTHGAVSGARFPPLVARSNAATLEAVTGLCDVAASSALWALPLRAQSTRRGGRVTRATHVRPPARAGENTRRGFRLRSAGAHRGLRAAKARNRFGKSAAATVHTRQTHPPVQERPPGLSLFDPGAGALACGGSGDVCMEIQRQQMAAVQGEMNKKIEMVEAVEWELFWAYTGGKAIRVSVGAFRAWRLSRAIIAARDTTVVGRTLTATVGKKAAEVVTNVVKGRAPVSALTAEQRGAAAAFYRDFAPRAVGRDAAAATRYNVARAELLEGTRDSLSPSLPEFVANGFE